MAGERITLGATRERPGFNSTGDLITYVDVPYREESTGSAGMVSIPKNQFTADLAQAMILAEVSELAKLHKAFGG